MRYYIKLGISSYPKNQLQVAIHLFCKTLNRKIIDRKDLKKFQKAFDAKIAEICLIYKRCKPETNSWHEYSQQEDISTHPAGMNINLYLINEESIKI